MTAPGFLEKIVDYFRFASLVKMIEAGGGTGFAVRIGIFVAVGVVIALFGRKIHKLVVMGGGAVAGAIAGHFIYGFLPNLAPAWAAAMPAFKAPSPVSISRLACGLIFPTGTVSAASA